MWNNNSVLEAGSGRALALHSERPTEEGGCHQQGTELLLRGSLEGRWPYRPSPAGQPVRGVISYCPEVNRIGFWLPASNSAFPSPSGEAALFSTCRRCAIRCLLVGCLVPWAAMLVCFGSQVNCKGKGWCITFPLVTFAMRFTQEVSVESQWKYHWGCINIANSCLNKCHVIK